jgi:hypothetical protein
MAPLSFQVDGRSPQIRLTPSWYLWERGEVQVRDGESGLVGVEVEIRDPQGRWPKVVRSYEASGASFAAGIEWDRRFADGTLAPIGSYEVVVKAWDRAGNFARQTASLHIPAPNVPTYTPAPAPTTLPVMVEAASPTSVPLQWAMEMALPTPTVLVSGFQTFATPPVESQLRTSPTGAGQSPVLWGMAALGAIGAATAYALGQRRKRKEEEARQAAEAAAEAARRNAAEAARRVQNWLQGQAMLQNALNNPALSDAEKQGVQCMPKNRSLPDPETADMTEKERLSLYRQSERYRAYQERMQAWEAERKRQQAIAAYQRYRQGEWADPQPVAQPQKPWWQKAGDWLQQKVVQPVRQAVPKVMNWVDQHQREIAIGIGIAAGVAAVVLSGGAATPLVAAAWVAGSAVVAGGVAAAGTVGLNAYFHRPLRTNVLQNLGYAAGAAAVTATAGFALGSLASAATKATASFCASHLAVCTTVSPVFKAVDQGWTAYDVWQSERVLKDRRASPQQKLLAAANIGLAAWSEGLEPDELLPVGLPLDDVARREVLAEFRKVLETEGEEAALRYLQRSAGKNAPQVIRAMYDQGLLREVRSAGEWKKIFERGVRQKAGLEVHHLIEQRFAEKLGLDPANIPSVVLTREEHRVFTNMWRSKIGYINDNAPLIPNRSSKTMFDTPIYICVQNTAFRIVIGITTANATREQIWKAAQDIYAQYPDLLEAIRRALFGQ